MSPLATMIPSATLIISSRFSIPSAFSILAITGISEPCSHKSCLISCIQAAFLTNEAAIKSNPCSTPNIISSLSLSVIPGSLILTLGTLTPFLEPSSPPLITVHIISVPSTTSSTLSSIRPSSIRIVLPFSTSAGSPAYVIMSIFSSPTTSLVVRVNFCPSLRVTFLSSLSTPVLISGPFVSRSVAIGLLISSLTLLTNAKRPACSS